MAEIERRETYIRKGGVDRKEDRDISTKKEKNRDKKKIERREKKVNSAIFSV